MLNEWRKNEDYSGFDKIQVEVQKIMTIKK